jgi:2-haloacid dehalogenase
MNAVGACLFDAYGTLFDVGSAAAACRDLLGDRWAVIAAAWRDKQLDYTWLRAAQGRHADFARVTADALDFTLAQFGIEDRALAERLLRLYRRLACYPEVPDCLRRLRRAGIRTAILSNGTPDMLAELVQGAGLDDLFDDILSVEEVGVFKPHPDVYRLAVDRLGLPAHEIMFLSSNGWDAHGASAFGLRVIWCNRTGQPPEHLPGRPEAEIRSLAELPELLGI